ncbi:MAG: patatin-like phospholipase family protein [Alphaproteobacteria bacterium]
MTEIGLVLQGGGALGAYEYGAVTRLIEAGARPVAITGVSIGAINAAAIAGARDGDIARSLRTLWERITLAPVPFVPAEQQATLSALGNPNFYRPRTDYMSMPNWTSLCDVSPMKRTLSDILDFERLNDTKRMRMAVTATNVATGALTRFTNLENTLGPDHILASGSLPPGFPMTQIDGQHYWDGGLFDNTPLRALMELLTREEERSLPIVVIDLFPTHAAIPSNLQEAKARQMEIAFENKYWDEFGGPDGLIEYAKMIEDLDRELPESSSIRKKPAYERLLEYRCMKNLTVIPSPHAPMTGGMDFSAHGVKSRHDLGYQAADAFLKDNPGLFGGTTRKAA